MSPGPRAASRVLLVLLAGLAVALPTRAHRGSTKYLVVERDAGEVRVQMELEVVDAAVALGLPEDAAEARVLARGAALARWAAEGVSVSAGPSRCLGRAALPTAVDEDDGPARLALELMFSCPEAAALTLRDETVFPTDAQHEAFVRQRFDDGGDAHVLRHGRQTLALGAAPSTAALVRRFLVEGMLHLVTGYDHVLFLLSLVLTAGGLARRAGPRAAARDVALVVTAFTAGHSVTLFAAALGWIVLPSRLVETAIAASILLVAVANVARPEARRGLPWMAGGFGLIHGFGFSGVLAELGLPSQARVLSLLAFNVGIEAAQLAVVALLLPPLAWLGSSPARERRVVLGGSLAVGLCALVWMVERATGP